MRLDWISLVSLAVLTIVWGSSFALTTVALESFTPSGILAGRLWLSTAVITAVALALGHRLPSDRATWARCALLGCLSTIVPFFLLAWGQQQVPSAVAAIFISVGPLFTLALSRLLLHEAVSPRKWAGFAVGLAGLIWLIGPASLADLGLASDLPGQLACMGAALSYALGAMVIRLMPPLPPLQATMTAQLSATVISLPLLWSAIPLVAPTPEALIALAILGIIQTAVAQLLRFYIVRRAGPVFMSTVGYLIPLWAGFVGIAFLDESLTLQSATGFALILTGLLLARNRQQTAPGRRNSA